MMGVAETMGVAVTVIAAKATTGRSVANPEVAAKVATTVAITVSTTMITILATDA